MEKRGIFFAFSIIFLLILIPNVHPIYEELVYEGTVEDRDVIEIEGSTFEFRIDSVSNKVYVEIDISGIIVGAGAIAIFGMSLGILLVIILLIVLAIYDAISVYKTKHMIDLADTVMDLKLPILLVIPKIKKYSLIKIFLISVISFKT